MSIKFKRTLPNILVSQYTVGLSETVFSFYCLCKHLYRISARRVVQEEAR